MKTRPGCQLVICRPDGQVLVQGMPRIERDVLAWVRRLAPVVPHDATWQVLGPDDPTPWQA